MVGRKARIANTIQDFGFNWDVYSIDPYNNDDNWSGRTTV